MKLCLIGFIVILMSTLFIGYLGFALFSSYSEGKRSVNVAITPPLRLQQRQPQTGQSNHW
jgi:hypothetical protein